MINFESLFIEMILFSVMKSVYITEININKKTLFFSKVIDLYILMPSIQNMQY